MTLNREALTALRERSGYTQGALAKAARIDRSLLSRIEAGQRNPGPDVLRRLASALKVPVTALMADQDGAA